MVEKEIKEGN